MTKLEELREFQKELEADSNVVDVKLFFGPDIGSLEELAADVLILLKGSGFGQDISNDIL